MLTIKEIIDKKTWEEFLTAFYHGSYPFFQSWNWGEVLENLSISVDRVGLYKQNKLIGILQIADIDAKRGHYLYLRQGPVLLDYNEEQFSLLLDYVKKLAKERNASFIRISRLLKTEAVCARFFKRFGFIQSLLQIIDTEVCPILDVTKSENELLKQMRKSHRYLIRKAKTMPIEIIKTTSREDLKIFLSLLEKLSKERNFVVHNEIEEEFNIFTKDNECLLLLAKYESKIIAGSFIDFAGNVAIYRHAATDENYRAIPASYLLQWEAILEAKKRGKKLYNFMGIAPEHAKKSHPWQGFTLFKTGFGAELEYYFPTIDLPLDIRYWKNYFIDWISKMKKGY